MSSLIELIDRTHDLTPISAAFLISVAALAVVWKALNVLDRSQQKKPPRKKP